MAAGTDHRKALGVTSRRKCDGERGDGESGEGRRCGPDDRGRGGRAEGRSPERPSADNRRRAEPDGRAEATDDQRFEEGEVHQQLRRGTARSQQRLFTTTPIRTRARDRRGQQPGEDGAREPEEEEQDLRVQRILAGRAERGAEVVPDESAARQLHFEVPGGTRHLRVRGGRVTWERVRQAEVDLGPDLVGPSRRERIEGAMPRDSGNQQHVVRGSLGLRPDRRTDLLEQRVCGWEFDHAVDSQRCRCQPGPPDGDRITRGHVEVGRGLLRDQDSTVRADEITDDPGERGAVGIGNPEHEPGTRRLGGTVDRGLEPGGLGEVDRRGRPG